MFWLRFARQSTHIEHGIAIANDAIERDALAWFDDDFFANGDAIGRDFDHIAIANDASHIGADIHQSLDIASRFVDGTVLKQLAYLIKQHYGYGLGILANDNRTNRRQSHEKVFVEDATAQYIAHGTI